MAKRKEKPVVKGPIMELIASAIKRNSSVHEEGAQLPFTKETIITAIATIISTHLTQSTYTFDPSVGTVYFSLPRPLDFFQELSDGDGLKVFEYLRDYFTNTEGWDDVVFINSRTGVTHGGIRLTALAIKSAEVVKQKD